MSYWSIAEQLNMLQIWILPGCLTAAKASKFERLAAITWPIWRFYNTAQTATHPTRPPHRYLSSTSGRDLKWGERWWTGCFPVSVSFVVFSSLKGTRTKLKGGLRWTMIWDLLLSDLVRIRVNLRIDWCRFLAAILMTLSLLTSDVNYSKSEYRYETKYKQNRGEIPKPNQLGNMRKIPTFYRFLSLLNISKGSWYQQNTKHISIEIPNTKLVSVWHRYTKKFVSDWHL